MRLKFINKFTNFSYTIFKLAAGELEAPQYAEIG